MINFKALRSAVGTHLLEQVLAEETEPQQVKHIHHAEDRPLLHGSSGFEHAHAALMHAHEHMKAGKNSSDLTMKYDGSPAIIFGRHPQTNKFFVASKSAFNKNPKINYSDADIERNHGHAPGLVSKLKSALKNLPKVAPNRGVYQGDMMHTKEDHKIHEAVSFTPNTITYTAHGDEAKKVQRSKMGVVVHQQYHENPKNPGLENMSASPHVNHSHFTQHPDVHLKSAEHDTSKINYPKRDQDSFEKHMSAAKAIHDTHGAEMYSATAKHQGEAGHLSTYINSTVRTGEKPNAGGLAKHIAGIYSKEASKLKTPAGIAKRKTESDSHVAHINQNAEHYTNLLNMHHHLQQAKNTLVSNLEKHEGGLEHHIGDAKSKPEGFVINHKFKGSTEPTKLVNRAEFAKANFAKVRAVTVKKESVFDSNSAITEELTNLSEAAKKDNPNVAGAISNNTLGTLHELLVGKALNGDKHMKTNRNAADESPEKQHKRLRDAIHPDTYDKVLAGAKAAAEHIQKTLSVSHPGHQIQGVSHTSKPGDTQKITKIPATQDQDRSDVYVTTRGADGKEVHHGVSLKVTHGANKHVPLSNPGIEHAGTKAAGLHAMHKDSIKKDYPELTKAPNKEARKAIVKSNPAMQADIKQRNKLLLHSVAKEQSDELNKHIASGNHAAVVAHLTHLLGAQETPAQKAGHNHIRHTTFRNKGGIQHYIGNPAADYSHILENPQHIEVQHSGTSVHFLYKGERFATHRHKFESQSNPLSSVKGSVTDSG